MFNRYKVSNERDEMGNGNGATVSMHLRPLNCELKAVIKLLNAMHLLAHFWGKYFWSSSTCACPWDFIHVPFSLPLCFLHFRTGAKCLLPPVMLNLRTGNMHSILEGGGVRDLAWTGDKMSLKMALEARTQGSRIYAISRNLCWEMQVALLGGWVR